MPPFLLCPLALQPGSAAPACSVGALLKEYFKAG